MRWLLFIALFMALVCHVQSQDPSRFAGEVEKYVTEDPIDHEGNLIIFTGSSSIRMWKNVDTAFPGKYVVNRGFGGSQMSDLLYYLDDLVVRHSPSRIFIYEGDNDIEAGKGPSEILQDAKAVVDQIRDALPDALIYFISAKPSIARWNLSDKYIVFNSMLREYTSTVENVYFIDVWGPMLDDKGNVRKDLFLDDGLHMNEKGYHIWTRIIGALPGMGPRG